MYRRLGAAVESNKHVSMLIYHNVNVHTSRDERRTRMSLIHYHLAASLCFEITLLAHLVKERSMVYLCEAATGISSEMCIKALRMSNSIGTGHARKHELLASR